MSDKVAEEVRILLKRLRTPAFRFVIAYYNHTDAVHYLEHKIREQFPEQPFLKLDASQTTYAEISQTFRELQHGILWLENFHDVLQLETDSSGKETAAMAKRNRNRSDITAGLNLRRDRWAKSPVALFLLISTPQLRVPLIKTIMEKMPDLWSFRTQVMDLEVRIPVRADDFGGMPRVESHIPRTTLGGDTLESQQAELNRLQSALSETPDEAVQLRNNLMEQISDLDAHIHHLTFGTPPKLSYIHKLIARDDLSGALAALKQLLADSPKLDEALLQSARFADIRKQIRQGTLSPAEASVSRNRIYAALLELLRDVEARQATKPALREEIEQAVRVVNSKHVVAGGNTSAGRDLHIGDRKEIHHHYGDKKIPRALTPNPFQPEVFIGREEELQAIHDKLFAPEGTLLLLNGEGGVGKTTLAARYYDTYQADYQHTAWLLCEPDMTTALLLLATPLGLSFPEQMGSEQRLELLLTAMAALARPCLLVLDNANRLADLERHYQQLRRCNNFHLLLTTRITEFQRAECYRIQGLPEPQALALFRRCYPKLQPEEEPLVRQIRTAVGGNTLVLELLAKNLAQANRLKTSYTLTDLLADLQSRGLLAITQTSTVATDYQSQGTMRHEKPEAIIRAMYDLSGLGEGAQALLSVFALLPAERIAFDTLEVLLPDFPELDTHLLALAQSGWLEYNEAAADFKCSPVVQAIAKEKNRARLAGDAAGMVAVLNGKLAYQPGVGHFLNATYGEARIFARYGEAVVAGLERASWGLSVLCERIGNYHATTGDLSRALTAYEKATHVNEALCAAEPDNADLKNGLTISYSKLGETHSALGDLPKALTFFEQYNVLEKELFEDYPQNVNFKNGLAISYSKLGEIHSAMGDLPQALKYFEHYNQLEKELHQAYPQNVDFKNGLAISYAKLAQFHRDHSKDLPQAKAHFQQAEQLWAELVRDAPQYAQFQQFLAQVREEMKNRPG